MKRQSLWDAALGCMATVVAFTTPHTELREVILYGAGLFAGVMLAGIYIRERS